MSSKAIQLTMLPARAAGRRLKARPGNVPTDAEHAELQASVLLLLLDKLRPSYPSSVCQLSLGEVTAHVGRPCHYAQLREATAALGARMLEVESADRYCQVWLFQSVTFYPERELIKIHLSEAALPYLSDLRHHLTGSSSQAVAPVGKALLGQ